MLKILYHLSMDDRVKSMFSYTDCVNLVSSINDLLRHKQIMYLLIAPFFSVGCGNGFGV